jgi:hypothetical protein
MLFGLLTPRFGYIMLMSFGLLAPKKEHKQNMANIWEQVNQKA